MNAGTSFVLRTSVQPISSSLRASALPSTASASPSVQPPTFFRFVTFLPELLHFGALRCSQSRVFCALRCCPLLLRFCLPFNHLGSSAFSPFSTGFCLFRFFLTSLSLIFHTSLSPFFFFINSCVFSCHLSFLLLDEACGRNVFNSTACCSTVCCSLNYLNSFRNG